MDSPDNGVTEGKPCFHQFTDVCDMHYCNKYKTCLHPNSGPDPHAVRVTAKDVLEGAMEEHVYDGVPVTLRGRRAYHGLCGTCGDRWDDGHGQDGNCQPNAEPLEDSLVRAVDTLRDEGNVLAKKFADQSPGGAPYPSPTKLDVPAYRRAKAGRFGITAHPQVEAEQNDIQVSCLDGPPHPTRPRFEENEDGSTTRVQRDLQETQFLRDPEGYGSNMESAGGTRFSEGKPGGWWYGPLYGLRLVSEVWTPGGRKYAPLDWKSGQSFSTLVDCAFRHFLEVQQYGIWSRDEDTGAYHVAAVVWNLLCLLTFMALGRHDLDDVTPWEGVTTSTKRDAEAYAEANDVSVLEALRTIKEDTNHGA